MGDTSLSQGFYSSHFLLVCTFFGNCECSCKYRNINVTVQCKVSKVQKSFSFCIPRKVRTLANKHVFYKAAVICSWSQPS